jgi:ABC-type phosphate/phosphonate transport system substrate-binding protein
MLGRLSKIGAVIALFASVFSLLSGTAASQEKARTADVVRIGLIDSLFRDIPEPTALALMQPFGVLMKAQTGMSGELVLGGDADKLGQQLADQRVQLGVFHGVEFAWARLKHPELQPLVIAVNQQRHLRARLIVSAQSKAASFADLQGTTLALPRASREHSHLFLQRRCQGCDKEAQAFFAKITNPPNAEEALDDVVDGIVQAAVVDGMAVELYKKQKPGRYGKLKILETSEVFPAAVIAYRPGVLPEATLNRFRTGMINANRTAGGKELLTLWKLTGFESIPQDYEQTLTDIAKTYPPPASAPK